MKKLFTALFSIFFLLSFADAAQAGAISAARILEVVNAERAKAGLGIVSFENRLNEAAGIKARDMAAKTYFDHVSPDGVDPWDLLARVGYDWQWAGENLALNSQTFSEEAIVKAWMNSPGHREVILTGSHTETGIGIATGTYNGQGVVYVSQFFASPKIEERKIIIEENAAQTLELPKLQTKIFDSISATTSSEVITASAVEIVETPKFSWKIKLNLFFKKILAVFAKSAQASYR